MDGLCDFCPRPGRLVTCMCRHEHRVGVWVCSEKHAAYLGQDGDISCRPCYDGPAHHVCGLHEVPA